MARRGENIRKRKDGRWEGRYIKARTSEGKVQWGYVYGTVYAEVKQVLIRKKAEAGFYNLKRTDLTFEALAEVWLHSLRNSIKESTYAQICHSFTPDSSNGAGSCAAKSHRQNFCASLPGGTAATSSICTGEPHASQDRHTTGAGIGAPNW